MPPLLRVSRKENNMPKKSGSNLKTADLKKQLEAFAGQEIDLTGGTAGSGSYFHRQTTRTQTEMLRGRGFFSHL
jgi:hypothetical protein